MSEKAPRPLRRFYHTTQKHMFEELGDGKVRVTDKSGREGIFHYDGRFIEGDLSTVNVHMLMYVGGPRIDEAFNYRWTEMAPVIDRPSGWSEEHERALEEMRKNY